jgi:hypothetical protein
MKTKATLIKTWVLMALAVFSLQSSTCSAQGTAFSYQGQINDGANPATGIYDLRFTIYDSTNSPGVLIAGPVTNAAVTVSNGLFTTLVDFGNVFAGGSNWLELAVSTNGANAFTTLAPRQQITPVPVALFAATASNVLGMVSASQLSGRIATTNLSGTVTLAQLPAGVITNGASGVNITGTFTGNGNGLIGVPATALVAATNIGVIGWGYNGYGAINIPAGLTNVTAVAAGYMHSLALKNDGTVIAWGYNVLGQTTIPAGLTNVTAIAAGYLHSLALKSDGTVIGWGYNVFGQTTTAGLTNVTAIAAGFGHSLALKSAGTVIGWGDNADGEINIPAGLTNVTAIAAGEEHSLALKGDGTVIGWGDNSYGQTNIPAGMTHVTAIAAGANHSLALKSDGTVIGWGDNSYGQTNIPAGLTGVVALAPGCMALHALAISNHVIAAALSVNGVISGNGGGLTNLNAAGLSGIIPLAQLPAALVINSETGVTLSGTFSGDGSGLTNLTVAASNVTGGIIWQEFATPLTVEWSFNGVQLLTNSLPAGVPANCRYLLADVFVTANSSDAQNICLGRPHTLQTDWVPTRGTRPSTVFGNLSRHVVTLTYPGESDGWSPYYGLWFSSQTIPVSGTNCCFSNDGNSGSTGWVCLVIRAYSL